MTHQPYPRYKPSGVAWLGDIPDHWEVKKLKYLAKINWSKPANELRKILDEEVVFLAMEKVSETGQVNQESRKKVKDALTGFTYFERNDVIVAKITPCFENGKGALLDNLETDFGYGSTEFHTIKVGDTILPKFLYALTRSERFMVLGEAFMTGSAGQKRVPTSFIEQFPIALPPLAEQTAIARYLDHETARLDGLMAQKRQLISLLQEERAGLINQAVTQGLNPTAPRQDSGLAWLGQIPAHWAVKKLKYVAKMKSGETITADSIRDEGDFPVFGGNGLRGFTTAFTHNGDYVLIGRQGALCGNINYATNKFWASEHAIVITIQGQYYFRWLGELLRTMNLNQYSVSAAQPGIAVERIQNLQIPVPPLAEQAEIVAYLDRETARIDATMQTVEQELGLLAEYRSALISEVVTGKVRVS